MATRIERWAYNDAAHIVGMSQGIVDGIVAVHPKPQKVTLVKNGVDLGVFRPPTAVERAAARAQFGIDGAAFVAAHIGNQSLTYDFDLLLAAASMLPDITFLFAGGGSKAAAIQAAAVRLPNVKLLGILPHDMMPTVWAASDVSLLAFRDHSVAGTTIPAKIYESFATGTPLVAAIRGEGAALIEIAGAGTTVPIGDRVAFAEALRNLAATPDRRGAYARAARAYAEATLSPLAVKDAYLAVLRKVAAQ